MRIEQLKQFAAVAKHGNFRKAGRELGISQPALTRSIQNLEHYFGVQLFDRLSSGVMLTEYGTSVLQWAEETVKSSLNVKRYVDLLSEASIGRLVIGTGAFFDDYILATGLSRLLKKYPRLSIRVIRDTGKNAEHMIVSRDIDIFLGMIDGPLKSKEIYVDTFKTGPISMFCRKDHPLLDIPDPDLSTVLKYPLIGPIVPKAIRQQADLLRYEATGVDKPLLDIEFDNYAQIRKVVATSDCVGALPAIVMISFFDEGDLVEIPVNLPGVQHYASFSYLKGRTLLPATKFIVEELTKIVRGRSRELRTGDAA